MKIHIDIDMPEDVAKEFLCVAKLLFLKQADTSDQLDQLLRQTAGQVLTERLYAHSPHQPANGDGT